MHKGLYNFTVFGINCKKKSLYLLGDKMIIVVNRGETVYEISNRYSVPVEKIIADNGVLQEILVVGQSLWLDEAEQSISFDTNKTVNEVSIEYGIEEKTLFRNNFYLRGRQNIPRNSYLVLSYRNNPDTQKIIGGYAYDFIGTDRLYSVINYLTYIMPFTYGFTPEGTLIPPDDTYILSVANQYGVKSLLHISTLTEDGYFDSNLPSYVFDDENVQNILIDNLLSEVISKGYDGVDIDFEYLTSMQKEGYITFTKQLSEALHEIDKILVIAVPPITSGEQQGILVDGIDYAGLGENADYILIMAYEYGYRFGPPLAIAPVNQIRRVLDYAVTVIPRQKILLGISNYGYNWTLPYIQGESDAPSISTVEAIELAKKYGAEIQFDDTAKAPFFIYTDEQGKIHEVWFEDARSFQAKMDLINEYNLSGGFIWDLMRENPQGFVTINSAVDIL